MPDVENPQDISRCLRKRWQRAALWLLLPVILWMARMKWEELPGWEERR